MLWTLNSCTPLLYRERSSFFINAPTGTKIIYRNELGDADTLMPDQGNNVEIVTRNGTRETFPVTIKNDSLERNIDIRPIRTLFYYQTLGLGFLFDRDNDPRFAYPQTIYLKRNPMLGKGYSLLKPYRKGDFTWVLSPPLANAFVFNLNDLNSAGSPFGIAGGINYYYRNKRFLSFETGVATVGRKTLLHRTSNYNVQEEWTPYAHEHKSGWYLNFRNHYVAGRFDFGYGISAGERFGTRFYEKYQSSADYADSFTHNSRVFSIGGTFVTNFRITNLMYAGINYQPQLMSADKNLKFNYEQLLSFGLSWRIPIAKELPHLSCIQIP
jgi:hypothetical protein